MGSVLQQTNTTKGELIEECLAKNTLNAIGFSRVLSMDQLPTNSQCCNGCLRRCGSLAITVSRAGGNGFIGAVNDMARLDQQLHSVKPLLQQDELKVASPSTLPIRVGFPVFATKLDCAFEEKSRHHPVII
jgi:hypothetical protein